VPPRILLIGMDGMNLPLLQRFVREGVLPTFETLMRRGSTNRILPALPAWTPTNWATMATGAYPGTHGLAGWTTRPKTAPWDAPRRQSWSSEGFGAETIFEVADQAGLKCLVNFWPSGIWPSRLQHGYVVAPGFHDAPGPIAPPVHFYCSPTVQTGVRPGAERGGRTGVTTDTAEEGMPPGSVGARLEPTAEAGWTGAPAGALAAPLILPLYHGGQERLYLLVERDGSGALCRFWVCERPDAAARLVEVPVGAWSAFITRRFGAGAEARPGSMRFRVLEATAEPLRVRLVSSQAYATEGFAAPEGLDRQLLEHCGPFFDTFSVGPVAGEAELAAFLDDIRYQGEWQVRVARYLLEHRGWDLHFSHWHLFDHINHPTVNPADPDGPDYDPVRAEWMIHCQRRVYQVADAVLAQFLELAGPETYVCVISDHGMAPAHRWGDVNARLAEVGLLVFEPGTRRIDLTRSKVYTFPDRGAEVFVNLAGREPFGIVPPEDYAAVQEAIIDALLDWRDPVTGKRPVALALKLEDAQIIGLWGEETGDVVFTYNRGYGWGPPLDGGTVGRGRGALHGSQIPTSETPYFTNMACFILAGPRVRAGYERDWRRYGLIRMVDIAPTLAYLAGLRPPAHNMGAVLYDLLVQS
jgi:predicted AlkP superfamily phosphohydrolase/phosphomutase